ncbi:MAG: glycosyltransferase [Salibacteraceae bacterium]
MHVLVIPNTWPSSVDNTAGTFFRDQVDALHTAGMQVGVAAPLVLPVGQLRQRFQLPVPLREIFVQEAPFPVLRYAAYNLVPGHSGYQQKVYRQGIHRLFDQYVAEHGLPDLIHAHVGLWAGWAAVDLAREHRIPLVITEHSSALKRGLLRPREKRLLLDCYKQANKVLAVSTDLTRSISRLGYEGNVVVVPNFLDLSRFSLPEIQKRPNGKLLTVALLNPNKGIDILLKAFAKVVETHPHCTLSIVGDGPARKALETLAQELGVGEQTRFLGLLPKSALPAQYRAADLMVSSSYVETFGVVLVEALACGTPVVATRSGGPEDIVTDKNGLLCEPGNVAALAEAISNVMNHPEAYPMEALRQSVVEKFDPGSTVKQLQDIYQTLIPA